MLETIIESVLTGKLSADLLIKWLNDESIEDASEDCILFCCNRSMFVAYFLSYIRTQTDSILQTNSNALQILQHQSTPEKILNCRRKHCRSISDPTSETDRTMDSLSVKTDRQRSHESPSKDRKKSARRVKTKLFPDDKKESNQSVSSSDESRLSLGIDRIALHSTPMKNGLKLSEYSNSQLTSPVTPHSSSYKEHHERCDTPRLSHRHSRSQDKSISLGDYLINMQPRSSKKKKSSSTRNVSSEVENESKVELDLSNSEIFPNLGARKSSSLRSEKRRIKPTNIDSGPSQKSFSMSNFTECFQHQSPLVLEENSAFKHQKLQPKELANSFETERNILKQERHKLMEKFNILNTSVGPKPVATPQIKITHRDCIDKKRDHIKVDLNKVCFKEKLDLLIEIYDVLLKNNLIMSINTEIYFLISILLSKQYEDDYLEIERFLSDDTFTNYLLKSIHNSTYFAIKSLWNERLILEVILDKNSLKTLGENKQIRSFYPDLAKFLLNSYGLKCEAENSPDKIKTQDSRGANSNSVVCFNLETDNVENFPSMLSFQNFKKQRDMFYEILRWYQEGGGGGGSRIGLRARAKALLSCGPAAANHAHLAALTVAHLVAESTQHGQESKLSKLQRRLTRPPGAPADHRLPHFAPEELFYKDLIIHAENESFRVHLRDALASEIIALDSTPIAAEDRGNNTDILRDFLQLSKKLRLLAKFLGFLTALPYSQTTAAESTLKPGILNVSQKDKYAPPKEKVLENNIALRNYSQPNVDLKGILTNALKNGHLCVTVPWVVHYLSMMDYTSLRIKYFQELLKYLFDIYTNKLKFLNEQTNMKKNTIIYIQSCLSWLFDLPQFPQELFYEKNDFILSVASELNIDSYDLIDESILFELCPYLRDVNLLLSTCKVSHEQKNAGSFRHITPVSLSLNHEDRMRNKEKELQSRLEEELLKSQPSSTRRVLELVTERVTAACVRQLSAHALSDARSKARAHAAALVKAHRGDTATLFQSMQSLYNEHLEQLRSSALEAGTASIRGRIGGALTALLPSAPLPLHALAVRGCSGRLARWLNDNWNGTAILCKDIESEMRTLLNLGDAATVANTKSGASSDAMSLTCDQFDAVHISTASTIIHLKEQVCLLLDYEEPTDLSVCLSAAAASCNTNNLFNRPSTQRAMMQLSVDLCVVYVSRKPKEINDTFLNKLHAIWNTCCPDRKKNSPKEIELPERREDLSPELRNFDEDDIATTPISDEESNTNCPKIIVNGVGDSVYDATEIKSNMTDIKSSVSEFKSNSPEFNSNTSEFKYKSSKVKSYASEFKSNTSPLKSKAPEFKSNASESKSSASESKLDVTESKMDEFNDELLEFFDRILCPRNIVLLSDTKCNCCDVWESLATVLVFLLKNDYLSEDSLTEQCLAVYRQDWPQSILENLSICMKSVSSRWSRSSTGKFTLFLDFLAEYCGDMDYEPTE